MSPSVIDRGISGSRLFTPGLNEFQTSELKNQPTVWKANCTLINNKMFRIIFGDTTYYNLIFGNTDMYPVDEKSLEKPVTSSQISNSSQ